MSSYGHILLETWLWIFLFTQVVLIPAALQSMHLINSSSRSLTSESEMMSAFVCEWRQTRGKDNLTIITSAWNQIEEVRERSREKQRKWRKKTASVWPLFTLSPNKGGELNAATLEWPQITQRFVLLFVSLIPLYVDFRTPQRLFYCEEKEKHLSVGFPGRCADSNWEYL